jgi:carbon monoxide dehydrogenase subunit G
VQLEHSFSVPVGIDEAWKILLDIERIGPCLPGAVIDSVEGDDFTGTVKVKLGPINLTYKGKASFVEKDEAAHRAVIDARGRDARGNGTATAVVTATLSETDGTTRVQVDTELEITGKPAQFGRGVMVDVGNKLLGQFADALAVMLGGPDAEAPPAAPAPVVDTPAAEAPAAEAAAEDAASPDADPPAPKKPRPRPARANAQHAADAEADQADAPEARQAEEPTPAYSVPGGIPAEAPEAVSREAVSSVSSVNGHLPHPRGEVEPINLLETAGPAVAKRLAPFAVAGVVVLLALRRRAGKRR